MRAAWDRGLSSRGCRRFSLLACAAIVAFAAPRGQSQEPQATRAPVPRAIILPTAMVAGAQATLGVVDGAGRLLPGVAVEISRAQPGAASAAGPLEKVTTDSTGRATFVAPANPGVLIAKISDRRTTISATSVIEMELAPQAGPAGELSAFKVTSYPRTLAILDRFTIEGHGFRGIADSNHVFLGEQPCLVAASSPISMVILPGLHIPLGAIALRVRAGASETGLLPVTGVLLDFSGPAETPTAGAEGKLILRVHGTTDPLTVEVRNASPEIVRLLRGNVQRLGTSGGEQNIAPVELKFLASGNYVITARVAPPDASAATPIARGGNFPAR